MADPDLVANDQLGDKTQARPLWRALSWLLFPSVMLTACAVAAMFWRIPTRVDIQATVSHADFHISGDSKEVILDEVDAQSLALGSFEKIRIDQQSVWIFDPAKYDFENDSYPESGWHRLPIPSDTELILTPTDLTSSTLTIRPGAGLYKSLKVSNILIQRGTVALSVPEPKVLSLMFRGVQQEGVLKLPDTFEIVANSLAMNRGSWPYPGGSIVLRVKVDPNSPFMVFTTPASGATLQARIGAGGDIALLIRPRKGVKQRMRLVGL